MRRAPKGPQPSGEGAGQLVLTVFLSTVPKAPGGGDFHAPGLAVAARRACLRLVVERRLPTLASASQEAHRRIPADVTGHRPRRTLARFKKRDHLRSVRWLAAEVQLPGTRKQQSWERRKVVIDRRVDLFSVLCSQFTYQAGCKFSPIPCEWFCAGLD